MKPLVIYNNIKPTYLQYLLREQGSLNFFELTQNPANMPPANVIFMRINRSASRRECLDACKLEQIATARGVKEIFNSVSGKLLYGRKDIAWGILHAESNGAPWFYPFPTKYELALLLQCGDLKYPFILRACEGVTAKNVYRIKNHNDLTRVMTIMADTKMRFLAMEYINTVGFKGYHEIWRPYIFGGKVDMWECNISKSWRVNLDNNKDFNPNDFRDANDIKRWPRHWDQNVVSASSILDLDVSGFDVVASSLGDPIILDPNCTYGLTIDPLTQDNIPLFSDEVQAIRSGHYKRLAKWLQTESDKYDA